MATRTLTLDTREPVALKLRAGYAILSIKVIQDAAKSEIILKGSQKILDQVTENLNSGTWNVRIPNEGSVGSIQINSFRQGGHVSTVIGGSGTVISGGSVVIGSVGGRGGRGPVIVDGVDVTGYVREQRGAGKAEDAELTAEVLLPAGSHIGLDVADGDVKVWGDLEEASVETKNASVTLSGLLKSGTIRSRNGNIHVHAGREVTLETHNGDIDLDSARGQTMVTTHNGNARVHAAASIPVMATSHNGDVDVTKAAGTSPRVMATTHNGRVRKP